MRRFALALIAVAACAPRADYTPRIDVEPNAAGRICWVCQQTAKRDGGGACPSDAELVCGVMFSDLKGLPMPTFTDSEPPTPPFVSEPDP